MGDFGFLFGHGFGGLAQLELLNFACAGFGDFGKDDVFGDFESCEVLAAMLDDGGAL